MEEGQVVEQPAGPFGSDQEAAQAALAILQKTPEFASERQTPQRDESGKFTKSEAPPQKLAEKEEAPAEEPVQETEPEQEAEPPPVRVKLKVKDVDGSDVEVEEDIEGLKKGYMLERAFRMKTAQLAREKEAVQAKIKEAVEPKIKEYETALETYKQAVLMLADREGANTDLNKLAEQDPALAQKMFFKRLEFNNTLQQIAQAQEKLGKEKAEEAQKAFRKAAQEAVETLQTEIPDWSNDLYGKILKSGKEYGFKAEELNAITDPRAIKVLNDARQWREFKAAKPATQDKKVTQAPKVVKPGAGEKPDQNADKEKIAWDKLRKSGHQNDAFEVAKLILGRQK